jgi:phenylpropionate dioxygenase-like ring-hydroxylating dioxygenase large terminal subunit
LDGAMRGAPDKASCFPDLDMSSISLHEASIGIFQDLVFVHPDAQPAEAFEDWASDLPAWPHNLTDGTLVESPYTLTYEMNCNWKVFYENAIDGYHLAYLHENTLGRATPDKNIWEAHGRHVVWYSTETGAKSPTTEFVREQMDAVGVPLLKSASGANFPGVYMMFPLTIITPSTTGFLVSVLEPLGPDKTLLHVRLWAMPERNGQALRNFDISDQMPGLDPVDGRIKLALLKEHPLKLAKRSGDFQIEDVWICEKMQRGLSSPRYSVGGLANGPGAEAPLTHFQQNLLDFVPLRP